MEAKRDTAPAPFMLSQQYPIGRVKLSAVGGRRFNKPKQRNHPNSVVGHVHDVLKTSANNPPDRGLILARSANPAARHPFLTKLVQHFVQQGGIAPLAAPGWQG